MKKLLLVSLCFLLLFMTQVYAQNRTVTGTVTSKEDGLPIPGVTVKVKGSTAGAQTTVSGKFSLPGVPPNSVLVFTYIGYVAQERTVPAVGSVDAQLEANNTQLGEVVVTGAYGRKLEEKATGYNETHLEANTVNESSEVNLLSGLAGKVAGLNVTTTGTGVDAGIKVNLRGSRSINNNNQALIVVDGTPLPNGDISSIDPNTIESYDVLNGGSASVLYGSEGSNGVIVITTKKGSAGSKPQVTYSNSFQANIVAYYPAIQKQFGQNGGENVAQGGYDPLTGLPLIVPYENELYGPAYDGHTYQLGYPAGSPTGPVNMQTYSYKGDPIKSFYNTGITEQNNLSVASGNADDYFNLSAQNVILHGITPFEYNNRNSVTMKAGKKYGIFKAEYSLTYTNAMIHQIGNDYNDQGTAGRGQSIDYALDQWPTDLNIKDFKDPKSTFADPNNFYNAYAANPYWAVYNSPINSQRNTLVGNINLTLSPTKYLDISYKLTDNYQINESKSTVAEVDFSPYAYNDPFGAGNIPGVFKAAAGIEPGTVSDSYSTSYRLQGDFLINLHPTLAKDFKTNLLLGNSFYTIDNKNMSTGSNTLLINGIYNVGYITGTPNASESVSVQNNVAYFGDLNVGYKDYLFVDGSIRNEKDSRLTAANRSYWYPGVNASFIFTDAIPALKNNKVLSYGKLRAAYSITAEIGINPYNIFNTYGVTGGGFPYGSTGGLTVSGTNYTTILPEKTTEIEFGTELGFFDNQVHGTFTYYKQNDRNQTLSLGTSPTTGYSTVVTNVGELQSSGFETSVSVSVLSKAKNKVGLDIGANLTDNESKVISLLNNVPQFSVGNGQYAVVGMPYPEVEGTSLLTDPQGRTIITPSTGYPTRGPSSTNILGRAAPEWILGLNSTVNYKFISFNVVAEYRGGYVGDWSGLANSLAFGGSSTYTTQNARQSFIWPNSSYLGTDGAYHANTSYATLSGNVKFWFGQTFTSTTAPFVTSDAFWKIREANLGFNLNQFIKNNKWVKGVKLSLTGRNLFIWVPKTNFWGDPETSAGGSNNGTVASINSIPGQRVLGAKLDVTF